MSEEVLETQTPTPEQPVTEGGRREKRPMMKPKRRVCPFCANKVEFIDWKDVALLRKYVTEKGKILPRRQTGLCAAHQRIITVAIKRAQNMSLI